MRVGHTLDISRKRGLITAIECVCILLMNQRYVCMYVCMYVCTYVCHASSVSHIQRDSL
jgi:hypothetical protein